MPVAMLSTSLLTDPKKYGRFNALDTPQPINAAMTLIKPVSIANSGGSASVGTNGQITVSGVTSVSINGCFNSTYDNYIIVMDYVGTDNAGLYYRMRGSGSDASGSNYTAQRLEAATTTVAGSRESNITFGRINNIITSRSSCVMYVYNPFIAIATATRSTTSFSEAPTIIDFACTHSIATSYDGITIYPSGGTLTGKFAIYGMRS